MQNSDLPHDLVRMHYRIKPQTYDIETEEF